MVAVAGAHRALGVLSATTASVIAGGADGTGVGFVTAIFCDRIGGAFERAGIARDAGGADALGAAFAGGGGGVAAVDVLVVAALAASAVDAGGAVAVGAVLVGLALFAL